jgi:hypothetical protein
VNRIEFEQMGCGGSITGWIIDMHQLDAGTPPKRTEHETTDAAESIDADAHGSGDVDCGILINQS